jgi:2-methylcitrate dehydratase
MTMLAALSRFVVASRFEEISPEARRELKKRVLDALGCAIAAFDGQPIAALRAYLAEVGGTETATLIGGGMTSPDRAALFNGALVRYLDYNDSYLAKGETCHPSDNLAAVLAAAEYADASGRDLLTALAVAYQVQCRLSDEAPVRARGFDHTTQGSYAAAAGVARALGLDEATAANAIAIAGTAFNALRVTRTGTLSNWKGLAYPNTAFAAVHSALLARHGITGPPEVFEGNKGFMETIAGRFTVNWADEDLERVTRTILKKFNAEIHSQSTIEAVLALRASERIVPESVTGVELEIFDVAYTIIGGGEEGDKYVVATKEQADHSLPYIVAAALLDGKVGPEQYRAERIAAPDVQALLRKVNVKANEELSRRFPAEMPVRVQITLAGGRSVNAEARDYEGFTTRPMPWEKVVEKFERLTAPRTSARQRDALVTAVDGLEGIRVRDLTRQLAEVGKE